MRKLLILFVLSAIAAPALAQAQGNPEPPLPRPRPAHPATPDQAPQPTPLPQPAPANQGQPTGADAAQSPQEAIARALEGPPQSVTLSAKISDSGPVIPSGLTWRIFGTQPDASGDLPLVQKSQDPTAVFELPPGEYLVHLAYGEAQTTESLTVAREPLAKSVVIDAGALRLHAQITGETAIPAEQLTFDIYPEGYQDTGRPPIETKVRAGATVRLNAGVYHIVSHYGSVNAVVKADLRVEPGQLTDATLFHDAAQVNFKLVSEEGGEAIADVEWTIKDENGNTVYSRFGAFPSAVLAKGDYTVFAKQGTNVYNRKFSVVPGPSVEIEVLTQVYAN